MNIGIVATVFGGLLGGILFRSFVDFGWPFAILLCLCAFGILLTSRLSTWVSNTQVKVALFLMAVALGIFRFDMVDTKDSFLYLQKLEGRTIWVEGVVIDEPKEKDKTTTLITSVKIDDEPVFNLLVITKPYVKYSYGDRVRIYGQLEKIKNFSEDFDYVSYLAKDEIYYQFLNPKVTLLSRGNGSYIQGKLFAFKQRFLENINLVIPEPESSLMGGLVLGAKSSLDKDMIESFKKVGLIHIVALSGYNVTVVADSLMKVIWFLPLTAKLSIGAVSIILFALMTGGGSTVVRASLMVMLALLARATGRIYLVASALLAAGILMILYNPKIFVFDVSFQLSFLATAGLIFFTPILEKRLVFVTERFGLRGMLVSTLSAQLAVWPIILYKMGSFSLVSVPANLLVGPVIPFTMFFGFVTGAVGFINYYISSFFSYISFIFLFYIIKITELFASLPLASLNIESFPLGATLAVYILYLWIIFTHDIDSKSAR